MRVILVSHRILYGSKDLIVELRLWMLGSSDEKKQQRFKVVNGLFVKRHRQDIYLAVP